MRKGQVHNGQRSSGFQHHTTMVDGRHHISTHIHNPLNPHYRHKCRILSTFNHTKPGTAHATQQASEDSLSTSSVQSGGHGFTHWTFHPAIVRGTHYTRHAPQIQLPPPVLLWIFWVRL